MYQLDNLLTHISNIQRHLDAIDSYKKNNIVNDEKARLMASRRKIYSELLEGAQNIYADIKAENDRLLEEKKNKELMRSFNILSGMFKNMPGGFEVYKVARKNNCLHFLKGHPDTPYKSFPAMDLNKFDCE